MLAAWLTDYLDGQMNGQKTGLKSFTYLSGILETFLMTYVLFDEVPTQVGLKYISPCVSNKTCGASADPHSFNTWK